MVAWLLVLTLHQLSGNGPVTTEVLACSTACLGFSLVQGLLMYRT
jgi:hypothetical protein